MRITGATDTTFSDGSKLPYQAAHRLKAADGSVIIGENYVDESCEMYIVSGYRNSVGAGCHNIAILNSSGCVVNPRLSFVSIINSSGVTVLHDHCHIVNSSGVTTTGANEVWTNSAVTFSQQTQGKKTYKALMSQDGSTPPTVIIFDNSIGDIRWTRDSAGLYTGTLAGAFTEFKTTMLMGSPQSALTLIQYYRNDSNTLAIQTFNTSGTYLDGVLWETLIQIEVYT